MKTAELLGIMGIVVGVTIFLVLSIRCVRGGEEGGGVERNHGWVRD